jgi:UDP-glucose:glycoprotein glucosyltransferase
VSFTICLNETFRYGILILNKTRLLRILHKERTVMSSLTSLGLSRVEAVELLTHPAINAAHGEKNVLDGLYDASDRPEEGGVITWWNDMQKDSRCVEINSNSSFTNI